MCDFNLLSDCGKYLSKSKSHISDEALAAANKICDILLSSHERVTDD